MNDIWKSKELWTGIVGAIATLAVYFTGKYFAAGLDDLQVVLNTLLPIILVLIGAYTTQGLVRTWAETNVRIEEMRLQSLQMQVRLAAMDAQRDAAKHG